MVYQTQQQVTWPDPCQIKQSMGGDLDGFGVSGSGEMEGPLTGALLK